MSLTTSPRSIKRKNVGPYSKCGLICRVRGGDPLLLPSHHAGPACLLLIFLDTGYKGLRHTDSSSLFEPTLPLPRRLSETPETELYPQRIISLRPADLVHSLRPQCPRLLVKDTTRRFTRHLFRTSRQSLSEEDSADVKRWNGSNSGRRIAAYPTPLGSLFLARLSLNRRGICIAAAASKTDFGAIFLGR
ncbi:related to ubiquinol--cytochrome-c reductase [Sporisorium scitamineum]|uniref:Related to ubiquinol--cytochrome-c reductase n=1 Tax=Sporisorium scitamineum TaxID=49012 RepID=A0A127ZEP5_9BASI|nr:related to ubiquinol--cytochrome-c reductase [Sporisorium scitamineum]